MENLPKEVLIEIFNHLDGHSLFYASKVNQLWSDIITGSIEITSRFCYKIYSGHSFIPDFMDYESLKIFFMGAPIPKSTDDTIRVQKFYPNSRDTEISSITDTDDLKSEEIMKIFHMHGKLWKRVNLHEVKLKDVEKFSEIFETLSNVTKLKIMNCEVAEEIDDEIMIGGKPLASLRELEVSKLDWRIFKALKHCTKVTSFNLTSFNISTTNDLNEFLLANRNLKTLEVYAKAKDSFDTSLNYKFQLENLIIDRSDMFNSRNEQSSCEFRKFEEFVIGQRKSLKSLKFKGHMSVKEIARIAKEMKLKEINLHLMNAIDGHNVVNFEKNRNLEKLVVIGSYSNVETLLKYYADIKYFEFNPSSDHFIEKVFITLTNCLPNVQSIKIYLPIEVPFIDPVFNRLNNLETLSIVMKSSAEIPQVLKCCPNLKKLSLSSDFSEYIEEDEFTLASVEEVNLTVQVKFSAESLISNVHKILKIFTNVSKVSINSQLEGKVECEAVIMRNLTTLKIDFTCTSEQCNNMYQIIRNCPKIQNLEMNSRLIGKVNVDGSKMEHLESLTVMGIAETLNAFQNLTNLVKISPKLKKMDFWIRGNSSDKYSYDHSDEINSWQLENFDTIEELKIWRLHKSEDGILYFLCGSCKNLKKIDWNASNDDLSYEQLANIFGLLRNLEELNFGKEFNYDAGILTLIRDNLLNIKKLTIYAPFPLDIHKLVREILDVSKIEIAYNTRLLEEWQEDEIVRI